MKIHQSTAHLLILLSALAQTREAAADSQTPSEGTDAGAVHTTPTAISSFSVDGLSLDAPYRQMHEALLAGGYQYTGRAPDAVEQMENSPRAQARFNTRTGESRAVYITAESGQIQMIRYEFDSQTFDPSHAIARAHAHLGEALSPCSQTVVEYQACVWEDAPGTKETGRVRLEIRKTSGRTPGFKVKYRIDRSMAQAPAG